MHAMQQTQQPALTQPVHLVSAQDPLGRACWFFVQAPEYRMKMLNARPESTRNVHDYGTIVARGWGTHPDAETLDHMKKTHGFIPSK